MSKSYPITPDGRYFVARGRLWRRTDPELDPVDEKRHVQELMSARRAVGAAADPASRQQARGRVQAAKEALGERGPVWWTDGTPDKTRCKPENTGYADWWAELSDTVRSAGQD